MFRLYFRVTSLAALFFALSLSLFAQTTGTITGTVTDQSGAVIPKASVTLTNVDSKDARHTVSNDVGFFSFTALPPATYSVKIESAGFRGWEQKGIVLQAMDRKSVLGIALQISQAKDSTSVEAVASAVEVADSGDRSATLTAAEIQNLALQGRDVTELLKTLPGFNNFTGNGSVTNTAGYDPTVTTITSPVGNGYSGNGAPTGGAISLTADGANVLDPGCNCKGTETINAEAVEEFKVTTAAYGADVAHGPVSVQAIGKAGSSEFHGGLYMHARNSVMNANDWDANNSKIPRPAAHYYYPGATIGGPVLIPGTDFNKNKKLLFFAQYEYYNQVFPDGDETSGIVKAIVPTADMRNGNFSPTSTNNQALCAVGGWGPSLFCGGVDTVTIAGTSYATTAPGNEQLQPNLLDPNIQRYMKALIPLPNATPTGANGGNNYIQQVNSGDNGWMTHERVDYNFNENNKLFITLNFQRDSPLVPVNQYGYAPPGTLPFIGNQVNLGKSQTLSGNYVHIFNATTTNEFVATLGHFKASTVFENAKAVSKSAVGWTLPGMTVAGGDSGKTLDAMVPSLYGQWWIPGLPNIYQADANGYFSDKILPGFTDSVTKVYNTHTIKAGITWDRTANNQLAWQAGANEVGLNGQMVFAPYVGGEASNNPIADFVMGSPTQYQQTNSSPSTYMAFWSLGFYGQDVWKISRHLTLSYGLRINHDTPWQDTTGKTGAAVWMGDSVYASDVQSGSLTHPGVRWHAIDSSVSAAGRSLEGVFYSPRVGLAYDIFGTGKSVLRGGFGSYYFHDSYNDYAGAVAVGENQTICGENNAGQTLSSIDASLASCQGGSSSLAIDPKDKQEPVTYNYSVTLSQQLPGSNLFEIAYSGNRSLHLQNPLQNINAIPAWRIVGKDGTIAVDPVTGKIPTLAQVENGSTPNDYRKYTAYAGAMDVVTHGANANYNAMLISVRHPRGPVVYGVNYTWSKTLGINGIYNQQPDPTNINNDYGIMNTDRAHVINATYSWDLGNHGHGLLGGVVNGWNFSGIIGIQSGMPMQQNSSRDLGLTFTGNALSILGSPDIMLMPDVICNPVGSLSRRQYINGNCYAVPSAGTNGPFKQMVRGPGYWNFDPSLAKSFRITEGQKVMFKVSAINVLNHPLWSFDPNNKANETLSFDSNNKLSMPNGVDFGVPNEKFGYRRIELTVRYNF